MSVKNIPDLDKETIDKIIKDMQTRMAVTGLLNAIWEARFSGLTMEEIDQVYEHFKKQVKTRNINPLKACK